MAKKIRKKSLLIVVMVLIALILLINGIIKIFYDIEQKHNNEVKKFSSEETKKPIESKSITISFAGDVTMGNYKGSPYDSTFDQEFKKQDGNYDYFFENVRSIFSEDDLTVVNLEGPLTTTLEAKVKQFAFKGDPSYVNILKSGDVEAVNLANNHSEDYFEEGIEETKFILKENNINYFGLGEKSVVDSNGIKVGLLGYNGWPENYNQENLDNMKNDIELLKKEANMVVVYFHWGEEKSYNPNQVQKDFAHRAIDSGADVVMGSHPHVLQGIEKYKEKYIAYSLSNFCFGGNKNPSDKDSMIYQQKFNFENDKLVSIDEPQIIPCSISSTKYKNDYKPTILDGSEKDRVLNKIKEISASLN
jgi:poly-gamma-glutamate synthesis protein (capsule biosynthesis protein)